MSRNAFQKRVDHLVSRACKAEEEAERLSKDNAELTELLSRAEGLLSKYQLELRKAKTCQTN